MARGFNRAIISGNLTRDPEVSYTIDKRAFARFGVAVNYSYKNKNGELKEEVDFIPVVVWGPMAENCGKYLKKGRPVIVEGRIRVQTYEAKDGSGKRTSTEIMANDVVFLGGGSRDDNGSQSSQYSRAPYPASGSASAARPAQPDDMPPFDPFGNDDGFGSSIDDKSFGNPAADFDSGSSASSNNEADIPF